MHIPSEYHVDIIQCFQGLQTALSQLQSLLIYKDNKLPCWFQPPIGLPVLPSAPSRNQIFNLIQQCEYLDHQQPRDILVGAGLVAASPETLQAIKDLNTAKDSFKASILALKAAKMSTSDPYLTEQFEYTLDKRLSATARTLKKVGLPRLHLKQCYRRIPILPKRPERASWTWANTKAITRITVQQAEALLLKQGNDIGIVIQLSKLRALSIDTPLAIVQELAPHLRANIVLATDTSKTTRIMVKGPVPLFYLYEEALPLPTLKPPGEKKGKKTDRSIRSDVKLDPEPFLPAIHVHQYFK